MQSDSEVPLHGENLAYTVEQAQAATQATSVPTNTISVESISGGSTAPSSSRSTPSATLVPLARVQKHEAHMATLLHHIKPLMQRFIDDAEERMEKNMAHHTERMISEVHQRLDAFELRVLLHRAPPVGVLTF